MSAVVGAVILRWTLFGGLGDTLRNDRRAEFTRLAKVPDGRHARRQGIIAGYEKSGDLPPLP